MTPPRERLALITGGAGFIATNVADRLLRDGWRVHGVDQQPHVYAEARSRSMAALASLARRSFRSIQASISALSLPQDEHKRSSDQNN